MPLSSQWLQANLVWVCRPELRRDVRGEGWPRVTHRIWKLPKVGMWYPEKPMVSYGFIAHLLVELHHFKYVWSAAHIRMWIKNMIFKQPTFCSWTKGKIWRIGPGDFWEMHLLPEKRSGQDDIRTVLIASKNASTGDRWYWFWST